MTPPFSWSDIPALATPGAHTAYLPHETPEWERSFYAVSQEQREQQLTFYLARASRPSAFSSADRGWRARSVRCRSGYDPDHQRYGPMPTR
jgi:hypothetical protein